MEEKKLEKETDIPQRKTVYDGIALSERGRDIVVLALSILLLVALIAAFVTSAK